MTGIGTPISHNRIPRTVSSFIPTMRDLDRRRRASADQMRNKGDRQRNQEGEE